MVFSLVLGLRLRQTQQRRKYWGQTGAVFNLNFFNEKTVIYKLCHCISFTLWYKLQDMSSINIKYAFAQKKKKNASCKLTNGLVYSLVGIHEGFGFWTLLTSKEEKPKGCGSLPHLVGLTCLVGWYVGRGFNKGVFELNLLLLKIENWKHCNKINFKCANSIVWSIFNIF